MRTVDKLFCSCVDSLHAVAPALGTDYNTLNVILAGIAIASVVLNIVLLCI